MANFNYTAKRGLKLQGDEKGAWMASTTTGDISNPSTVADLSTNSNDLTVNGTLSRAAASTGTGLVAFSGFSSSNYLERAYDADFDFGTGDWCFCGWVKVSDNGGTREHILSRAYYSGGWSGGYMDIAVEAGGAIRGIISDDGAATWDIIVTSDIYDDNEWHFIAFQRNGAKIYLWIDGEQAVSAVTIAAALGSLSNANASLILGANQDTSNNRRPLIDGNLSLWRALNYDLTEAQIKAIYNSEKHLFRPYSAYTQVDQVYDIDFTPSQLVRSVQTVRNQSKSISGNTETIKHRDEVSWDLTTKILTRSTVSSFREFLYSTALGGTFTFDPYGTDAAPDDPISCYLDSDSYTEMRDSVNDMLRVSMKVREA